jgi:peptide/nickel transport system substrate-binding protein
MFWHKVVDLPKKINRQEVVRRRIRWVSRLITISYFTKIIFERRSMSKRKIIGILTFSLAILLLFAMLLPACSPAKPTGGILHVNVTGPDTNSPGWAPTQQSGWDTFNTRPIDEALARFDENGVPKPYLAESWTTDVPGKSVTVKLRKDVTFQDGTAFNAAAVKWNWEQYVAAKRPEFPPYTSVDIIDDYTLKVNMVQWDNTILTAFCLYPPSYVSPTAFKNAPGTDDKAKIEYMLKTPVSTGAFILTDWQRGTKDVYKKNPNYWQKGKPFIDGIEITFIPDPLVAAAAFQSKEIDVWHMPPPASCKTLKDGNYPLFVMPKVTGLWQNWVIPNTVNSSLPFKDVRVRQAMAYALDSKGICDGVWMGYATVSNQYALPGTPWYSNDVKGYPTDLNKAKQLLADAGFPNGFKTKVNTLNRPTDTLMATAVQGQLAKIGITVEVEPVDTSRFSVLVPGTWDGMLIPGMQLLADPALRWSATLRTGGYMYANGMMHTPELDKLIDEARSAPTLEEKQAKIRAAQVLFFDKECIGIPIAAQTAVVARHPYVKDDGIMFNDQVVWTPESVRLEK